MAGAIGAAFCELSTTCILKNACLVPLSGYNSDNLML
jgi:hypothetical protein